MTDNQEEIHTSVLWRRQMLDLMVKRNGISYTEALEKIIQIMPYSEDPTLTY